MNLNPKYSRLGKMKFRYGKTFQNFVKSISYNEKELAIKTAMAFVKGNNVEGDYFEFGVYDGVGSFIPAYHFAQLNGLNDMRFWAYDSFEGLPEPQDNEKDQFSKGQFCCSQEDFMKNLRHYKAIEKTNIIAGWFDKTLKKFLIGNAKASIIYIDVDLEESSRLVFDYITPLIQDGTIIFLDDYFCFKGKHGQGERHTFNLWLKKNGFVATEFRKFWWYGNSFIINKRGKDELYTKKTKDNI